MLRSEAREASLEEHKPSSISAAAMRIIPTRVLAKLRGVSPFAAASSTKKVVPREVDESAAPEAKASVFEYPNPFGPSKANERAIGIRMPTAAVRSESIAFARNMDESKSRPPGCTFRVSQSKKAPGKMKLTFKHDQDESNVPHYEKRVFPGTI
jgi:hypothetical protein